MTQVLTIYNNPLITSRAIISVVRKSGKTRMVRLNDMEEAKRRRRQLMDRAMRGSRAASRLHLSDQKCQPGAASFKPPAAQFEFG